LWFAYDYYIAFNKSIQLSICCEIFIVFLMSTPYNNSMNLQTALQQLPETDKNVIAVLSGGMDSSIATMLLVEKYGAERVFAVSYDYGQKQKEELKRAHNLCCELGIGHKVLDLSILGDIAKPVCANISGTDVDMPTIKDVLGDPQPPTYVPFRNMILISLTAATAEVQNAEYIFGGWQIHDEYGYWDTSQVFIDRINNTLQLNRKNTIKCVAPFSQLSKTEEIAICLEMSKIGLLEHTLTCYDPDDDGRSCGRCPSCSERVRAFMNMGRKDPVEYSIDIPWPAY
jgi:7-cyano-7-deazaguanine synthase